MREAKSVRLRGHHILCAMNFAGEGYSPEFVENMRQIVERLRRGEEAEVVVGCDDICAVCPHMREGKCAKDEGAEERARLRDEAVLSFFGLEPGERVVVRDLWRRVGRADFEALCQECEWFDLCRRVFAIREGRGEGFTSLRRGLVEPAIDGLPDINLTKDGVEGDGL